MTERQETQITFDDSWGVCDDTCSQEYKDAAKLTGQAKFKHVQIMEQEWCDQRLKNLREPDGFQVFPQVYCVAYNESYRTQFWKKGTTP